MPKMNVLNVANVVFIVMSKLTMIPNKFYQMYCNGTWVLNFTLRLAHTYESLEFIEQTYSLMR